MILGCWSSLSCGFVGWWCVCACVGVCWFWGGGGRMQWTPKSGRCWCYHTNVGQQHPGMQRGGKMIAPLCLSVLFSLLACWTLFPCADESAASTQQWRDANTKLTCFHQLPSLCWMIETLLTYFIGLLSHFFFFQSIRKPFRRDDVYLSLLITSQLQRQLSLSVHCYPAAALLVSLGSQVK